MREKIRSLPLAWVMFFYAALAVFVAGRSLDALNVDGIIYVLLAEHYVRGDWSLAVSGSWSPMVTWLLAPFIYFGFDPIHASRFLSLVSGAGFVAGVWLFSSRFLISLRVRVLLALSTAVTGCFFALIVEPPDLMLLGVLAVYFYLTLDPDFGRSPRLGFWSGAAGGLAYLCKSYAGPFFLLHYFLMLAWAGLSKGSSVSRYRLVMSCGWGLLGFALIAGPWIAVISQKYGHLTLSTNVGLGHASLSPDEGRGVNPIIYELRTVPPGRLTTFEDPSLLPIRDWSPFASWEYFKHQMVEVLRSFGAIIKILWQMDLLKLGIASLAVTMARVFMRAGAVEDRRNERWALITIASYCSGYLLVFASDARYYWPVFMILFVIVFRHADRLVAKIRDGILRIGPASRGILMIVVLSIPLVSFSWLPVRAFAYWHEEPPRGKVYREIARDLMDRGIRGPIASTQWTGGLYLSYFLREPFGGRPIRFAADSNFEKELIAAGIRTLFIWGPAEETGRLFKDRENFKFVVRYRAISRPGLGSDLSVYRIDSGPP